MTEQTASEIIKTTSTLTFKDRLGAYKVRWGFGRMTYSIYPGLYSIGNPNVDSPVLVTANYKLTFDQLRQELSDFDAYILVLNTDAINVWCAAGKGTFGTKELINRIYRTNLKDVISHRQLILPQLGAPGVDSSLVTKKTEFNISYGPAYAKDIKKYFLNDCKATKEMRKTKFNAFDRLVLTSVELMSTLRISLYILGVIFILNLFVSRKFALEDFTLLMSAILSGTVIAPVLLPIIPGRAFSFKGWLVGVLVTLALLYYFDMLNNLILPAGYLLAMPAISSYLMMNFTGSTTFTSPSGVLKEMKIALPFIIGSLVLGIVLLLVSSIIGG